MKKQVLHITMILVFALALYVIPINAKNGSISIKLKELSTPKENVTFQLYQVGKVENQRPMIDQKYHISKLPETAKELDNCIQQISSLIDGEPYVSDKTDIQGKVYFGDIDEGVYLLVAKDNHHYGQISSSLIIIPSYIEVDDEISGPRYDLNLEPKASIEEKPEVPEQPEDSGKTDTGDTFNMTAYYLLMTLTGGFIILLIMRRKKAQ